MRVCLVVYHGCPESQGGLGCKWHIRSSVIHIFGSCGWQSSGPAAGWLLKGSFGRNLKEIF